MKTKKLNSRQRETVKLLNAFQRGVSKGYSDENFEHLAEVYNSLEKRLSLREVKNLGEFWRQAYTDSVNMDHLKDAIEVIKSEITQPL